MVQCDIQQVPLLASTLDVAVFCLSLMGTNFPDFLVEANRVLKLGGILYVAEALSRFKNVKEFSETHMSSIGFKCLKINKLNEFFNVIIFKKVEFTEDVEQKPLEEQPGRG